MAAKKKEIVALGRPTWSRRDEVGAAAPRWSCSRWPSPKRAQRPDLRGDPVAAARALAGKLQLERGAVMAGIWTVLQHRTEAPSRLLGGDRGRPVARAGAGHEGGRDPARPGRGALAAEVAACDLGSVRVAESPLLAAYTPGGYVAALAPALTAERPDFVLFPTPTSPANTCRASPRPATWRWFRGDRHRRGSGRDDLQAAHPGGKMHARVRLRRAGTALVTLQSGATPQTRGWPVGARAAVGGRPRSGRGRARRAGTEQIGGDTVDLSKADVIVAVGRGLAGRTSSARSRSWPGCSGRDRRQPSGDRQRLAAARPPDRLERPDRRAQALLALGISGAIQHLVG